MARVAEIDAAIGTWTGQHSVAQVMERLAAARVPAGKVYTAKDIAEDPHYQARGMLLQQQTRDGYSMPCRASSPSSRPRRARCAPAPRTWATTPTPC